MKSSPDEERFARYQSVVNALLAKESFKKPDIYKALREGEKPFIGKVIGELVRDGYLNQGGPERERGFEMAHGYLKTPLL